MSDDPSPGAQAVSDAVERVAKAVADLTDFGHCRPEDKDRDIATLTRIYEDAYVAINAYKSWLAEQGIPVDKLLSGEMVAIEDILGPTANKETRP